jgi:hypothetical protein
MVRESTCATRGVVQGLWLAVRANPSLRTADLTGYKRPARLDQWLQDAPFTVDQSTIDSSTSPGFKLPPAQTY